MKVTLIAQDMAPSQALQLLATALEAAGHITSKFLAHGKQLPGTPDQHSEAIRSSPVLVVGMSSSMELARIEIEAVQLALSLGQRVYFFADTFGVHNRPWLQGLLPGTTLFHISEAQAEEARSALPDTWVIATGNPMWETFFHPQLTPSQVRDYLNYTDDTRLILVPGGKSEPVNIFHFTKAIDVAKATGAVALISLHPGDKTKPEVYQHLVSESGLSARVIPNTLMSGSAMLPGVDWVVESASGVGIEAACQRIPVFTWFSPAAKARLKEATGSDEWPLCTAGVSHLLPEDFTGSLMEIDYAPCLQHACELFQPPEKPGAAIEKMVKEITT